MDTQNSQLITITKARSHVSQKLASGMKTLPFLNAVGRGEGAKGTGEGPKC